MTASDTDSDTGPDYGHRDTTFQAVGGERGVKQLVEAFYDILAGSQNTRALKDMHPVDLSESRDKLYRFLCGWMGGPKRYRERYGPINIIASHRHLQINQDLRDQWLWAMHQAIAKQDYSDTLAEYLMAQLSVPADRILAHQQTGFEQ